MTNEADREILEIQRQCEDIAKQRHRQVYLRLQRQAESLAQMHNSAQIKYLLAEMEQMNLAHRITRDPPTPRWLPKWLYRLLTRIAAPFVIPHVQFAEENQTRYNIHATKTMNEVIAKMLQDEEILLNHAKELANHIASLHSALDLKYTPLLENDPTHAAETPEVKQPDFKELAKTINSLKKDLEDTQSHLEQLRHKLEAKGAPAQE